MSSCTAVLRRINEQQAGCRCLLGEGTRGEAAGYRQYHLFSLAAKRLELICSRNCIGSTRGREQAHSLPLVLCLFATAAEQPEQEQSRSRQNSQTGYLPFSVGRAAGGGFLRFYPLKRF